MDKEGESVINKQLIDRESPHQGESPERRVPKVSK